MRRWLAIAPAVLAACALSEASERYLNDYSVIVPGTIYANDTTIALTTGQGQPVVAAMVANPGDTIHMKLSGVSSTTGGVQTEYLLVNSASPNSLNVTRAQEGTASWSFFPGARLTYVVSAGVLSSIGGGGSALDGGSVTSPLLGVDAGGFGTIAGDASITGLCAMPFTGTCDLELASGGIQQAHVASGAIGTAQLGVDAGSFGSIAGDGSITGVCQDPHTGTCDLELAAGGVQSGHIANGAVRAAQLGLDAGSAGTITCIGGLTGSPSIPGGGTCAVATNGVTGTMLGVDAGSLGSVAGDGSITGACSLPGPACDLEIASAGVQQGHIANNAVRTAQMGVDAGGLGTVSGDGGISVSCSWPGSTCTAVQATDWSPTESGAWTFSGSGTAVTVTHTESVGELNLSNQASIPSAPSSPNLVLFNTPIAGRQVLGFRNADDYAFLGARWGAHYYSAVPMLGNGNSTTGVGAGALIVSSGTLTTPSLASGAVQGSSDFIRFTSAASTNSAGALCTGSTNCTTTQRGIVTRGSVANSGGFFGTFAVALNTNASGSSAFVGYRTAGAFGTDPSAYTDELGVGFRSTDATTSDWFLFRSAGGSAATAIDLGSNCQRNTTSVLQFTFYCPSNGSFCGYHAYNASTQTLCAESTVSTTLPTNTAFLMIDTYQDTNANSSSVVIDVYGWFGVYGPAVN